MTRHRGSCAGAFPFVSAGDGTPPSLISAGKLTLTDVHEPSPDDIPDGGPLTPFSRDDVMHDLRKALVAKAAMIARWGSDEAAEAFLGFPSSDNAEPSEVDLSRFRSTPLIEAGYDWAFQTGQPEAFHLDTRDDLRSLMDGGSSGTISTLSPMADADSALRVTVGTAFARWKFEF